MSCAECCTGKCDRTKAIVCGCSLASAERARKAPARSTHSKRACCGASRETLALGGMVAPMADSAGSAELADFLARRARFDEDSWIVELDIAAPERFIAETIAAG